MKQQTDLQVLETLAHEELDHSIQDLDSHTLARLRAARAQAVELVEKSASRSPWYANWSSLGSNWLPVSGIAATAAAVALSVSIWLAEPSHTLDLANLEDLAVLSANEDLDLFDELEFYQWLENEKLANS